MKIKDKTDYNIKTILNKQGAMFGLDARIALAIFGALSVISGAALYSAIQSAQTEKWRQYFEELSKASTQYYLDNGINIPQFTGTNHFYSLKIKELFVNDENLSTWKGPYLSISAPLAYSSDHQMKDSVSMNWEPSTFVYIFLRKSSSWSEMNDLNTDEICTLNDNNCSEWVTLYAGNNSKRDDLLKLFTNLDNLVDAGDGELQGKVRYNTYNADYIMYQGIPHKRTL
jgi:type II secretory pathway pseudopilin PulG